MEHRSDEQLRQRLRAQLSRLGPCRRKQLIEAVAAELSPSAAELADKSPQSPLVREKSRIGALLTELVHTGCLREDALGLLYAVPAAPQRFSPGAVRDFLAQTIAREQPIGRQRLFALSEAHFGTDQTPSRQDDNALRSIVGNVLAELEREQALSKGSRGYRLLDAGRYPATELGGYLRAAACGGDLKQCFLEAVHTKGGEWFESYCVELLRRYFLSCGKTVLLAQVTGGSDDGGIDGKIQTQDALGYRECVLMQMKNRHAVMTAKDVREFYGAVCAENGSRGIFITLSSFHPQAQQLLDKVDNLTGVDGERLFAIAGRCRYGLQECGGVWRIDETLLLGS